MNVDPKQIEGLISTFCEMNDEFREKAVAAVNKVFYTTLPQQLFFFL